MTGTRFDWDEVDLTGTRSICLRIDLTGKRFDWDEVDLTGTRTI